MALRSLGRSNHADPEVARRLMALARSEAVRIIVRHGGRFHAGLGSQLLGVFGLSASHEDDALRALNTAVQLREGVTTLMRGEPGTLDLRIGLDAGEIVAEGVGEDMSLFGDPLDGAVGLASTAREGQILLSEATRRLAPDAIRVQPATGHLAAERDHPQRARGPPPALDADGRAATRSSRSRWRRSSARRRRAARSC